MRKQVKRGPTPPKRVDEHGIPVRRKDKVDFDGRKFFRQYKVRYG